MPPPTREQFDAAARKVADSAPAGLSKDDFYGLIDKELASQNWQPGSDLPPSEHGASDIPPKGAPEEPGTFSGGFFKSLKDQVLNATTRNPKFQDMAAPVSNLGGVLSYLLPTPTMLPGLMRKGGEALATAGDAVRPSLKTGPLMSAAEYAILDPILGPKWSGAATAAPYVASGMGRGMQRVGEAIDPAFVAHPPVPFNDLPLAQQMDRLPATGDRGLPTRAGDAPHTPETPFHEKPLWQQMSDIPESSAGAGTDRQPMQMAPGDRPRPGSVIDYGNSPKPAETSPLEDTMSRMQAEGNPTAPLGMPRVMEWKPGMGPDPADVAKLRALEGSKSAGSRLAIPQAQVKEMAPQMEPAALPTSVRDRIAQNMQGMTAEEKAAYRDQAQNEMTRAFIDSLLK